MVVAAPLAAPPASDAAPGEAALPRACTFAPEDWAILARHWYPVARAQDLGERPVAATLLDEPLVLYRAGGGTVVARDLCPHRGVPLSLGRQTEGGVACAYHGLRFGADGRCTHIPASPGRAIPERMRTPVYPAVERYGLIWTCLRPEPESAPAIPPMPHWDAPEFQRIVCPSIDIAGFAGRQMEGFLDVAHFAFVHGATFADADNAEVPPYKAVRTPDGFVADYRSSVANYPVGSGKAAPPGFVWLRHFECHLPFVASLTVHFPDEGRLVILNAASPVSARMTRLFVPIARNFDTDRPVQDVYDFNRRVFEEDRAMVEAQRPEWLPLDPMAEAHILADAGSLAYRRGLAEMGLGRFFTA